jgi:hypothetical protein
VQDSEKLLLLLHHAHLQKQVWLAKRKADVEHISSRCCADNGVQGQQEPAGYESGGRQQQGLH